MPYEAGRLDSDRAEAVVGPTGPADHPNPFLQLVDPAAHRRLVERALSRSEVSRLITPLSRLRQRKAGAAGLDSAWDEDLADGSV